ncbi:MAG: malate dehydrogenase (quinone) [Opitutaceae bacterium]|nr:malate dehydrogenase (quinone) [Opitutaceae bacterium]
MNENDVDVLLVGGGVMSATLGTLLARLDPSLKILLVERLDQVAQESTDGWNNAGTGHAGYCELNYTPQNAKGDITINRALAINAAFEVSLQFWSALVEQNALPPPSAFIQATPHQNLVWGEADVGFLRQRHGLLTQHHLFHDMEYTEDPSVLRDWTPLIMQGRDPRQKIAATRVRFGSDVDFGALTRCMIGTLQQKASFELIVGHAVDRLARLKNGRWQVGVKDCRSGGSKAIEAGFVFLGAGGGALPLLQKSGILEGKGYGGFPVSGQWLICKNPAIIRQHHAKVYGKASLGAPPMSVPHLDTRIISGQPALLFGPYAGFTTKFLKQGSWLDLLASVKPDNLKPMLAAGWHNLDLIRYLIGEVFQSHRQRVESLRNFFPAAEENEWELAIAGQRVQIIKRSAEQGGKLEFGTEIVAAADGSLAALLGASPGASTAVTAMIGVIERCFADRLKTADWQGRIKALVPSYGQSLVEDGALLKGVRQRTLATLGLG